MASQRRSWMGRNHGAVRCGFVVLAAGVSLAAGIVRSARAETATFTATTGDGCVYNSWPSAPNNSYPAVQQALVGEAADWFGRSFLVGQDERPLEETDYGIYRGFLAFDTASIPDNAVITSATLSLYRTFNFLTPKRDFEVMVVSATQASVTELVREDYPRSASPRWGCARVSELVDGGYTRIPLFVGDSSWLNKAGYTKLALRSLFDLNASAPNPDSSELVYFAATEYRTAEGTPLGAPTLEVTYTEGRSLEVLFPAGGETLYKGTPYRIRWAWSNYSGTIKIHVYKGGTDASHFWKCIDAGEPVTNGDVGIEFNPPEVLDGVVWPDAADYRIGMATADDLTFNFSEPFTIATPVCVRPTDGMALSGKVTLCPGTYALPNGLRVENSPGTVINGNGAVIEGNGTGTGVTVQRSAGFVIRSLTVRNYFHLLDTLLSPDGLIEDTTLSSARSGVTATASARLQFRRNRLSGITGGSGISLDASDDASGSVLADLADNEIADAEVSLDITNRTNPGRVTVARTTFRNASGGITATGAASPYLSLSNCNFINNRDFLICTGTTVDARFNWWGITSCPDIRAKFVCGTQITFEPLLDAPYPGGSPVSCGGQPATAVLTVTASPAGVGAVPITIEDEGGTVLERDVPTTFTRTYPQGTVLWLTAPLQQGEWEFDEWVQETFHTRSERFRIIVDRDRTAEARYRGLPLPPPGALVADVIGATSVRLRWPDYAGEDGFILERKIAPGDWERHQTPPVDAVSFTDTGLPLGVEICYRLAAFNARGTSPFTEVVCVHLEEFTSSLKFIDPVPQLLSGSQISTDTALLADKTKGISRDGVAGDGVAKLVIRFTSSMPGTLELELVDKDGQPLFDHDESGLLTDRQGTLVDGFVRVNTLDVNGQHTAFALYTAPSQFARRGVADDVTARERLIFVKGKFISTQGQTIPLSRATIIIGRPPVILVHGIWSGPETWDNFQPLTRSVFIDNRKQEVNDPRFFIRLADYMSDNSEEFEICARTVYSNLGAYFGAYKRQRNLAVIQADFITHSMGGPVVRLIPVLEDENRLGNIKLLPTFGKGPIHKLITIGGVLQGTLLADFILDTPCAAWVFDHVLGKPTGNGAVADLAVRNQDNNTSLKKTFQLHTIVGRASCNQKEAANGTLNVVDVTCRGDRFTSVDDIHCDAVENNCNNDIDRCLNDVMVGAISQRNGMDLGNSSSTDYDNVVHSDPFEPEANRETNSQVIANRVIFLLNSTDPGLFTTVP